MCQKTLGLGRPPTAVSRALSSNPEALAPGCEPHFSLSSPRDSAFLPNGSPTACGAGESPHPGPMRNTLRTASCRPDSLRFARFTFLFSFRAAGAVSAAAEIRAVRITVAAWFPVQVTLSVPVSFGCLCIKTKVRACQLGVSLSQCREL